jgi:CheY-like chemotaxis protein
VGKLRAGEPIKPSLGSVDVRVLLDRCKTLLEGALPSAASPDVALTTQVADGIQGQIITDRCWLWQMTMSYLTNAYKFTHSGEIKLVVRLAGGQNGRFLRFEVHDTGIGVEAAQRDSLFVPWNGHRGGSSSSSSSHAPRAVGAARLGLYSVKVKSEQLGGSCGYEAKAAPEQGSVFYFQVPYIPEGQRFENQFERMQHMASNAIIKGAESDTLPATAAAPADASAGAAAAAGAQPSATVPRAAAAAAASSSTAAKPKLSALQRSMQAARAQAATAGAADGSTGSNGSSSSAAAVQRHLSGASTDTATTTESESSTAAAAAAAAEQQPAAAITGPTALVIDDTGSVRKLLCKTLEGKGLRCDVARNGLEGLHMMRCKRYSVVLCDAFMPVMGGMECIQRFRQWEESHLASTTTNTVSSHASSSTATVSTTAAAAADSDATATAAAANTAASSSSSSGELRTQRQFIVGISSYLEGFDRDSGAIDAFLSKPIDLKWLRELLRIAMHTQEQSGAGGGPFIMAPSDAVMLAENGASSNAL